jgi:hypothetical protein
MALGMSFRFRLFFALICATALSLSAAEGQTLSLKPFKDDLFAYPPALSTGDNGAYTVLDYHEMRDINQRDEVPEKRVRAQYTDPGVRRVQQDLMLKTDAGDIRHVAVGRTEGASIIVLYLHGQGGSRKQGVDDFTFGGNFNRIKNLMAGNGGLHLALHSFPPNASAHSRSVSNIPRTPCRPSNQHCPLPLPERSRHFAGEAPPRLPPSDL